MRAHGLHLVENPERDPIQTAQIILHTCVLFIKNALETLYIPPICVPDITNMLLKLTNIITENDAVQFGNYHTETDTPQPEISRDTIFIIDIVICETVCNLCLY